MSNFFPPDFALRQSPLPATQNQPPDAKIYKYTTTEEFLWPTTSTTNTKNHSASSTAGPSPLRESCARKSSKNKNGKLAARPPFILRRPPRQKPPRILRRHRRMPPSPLPHLRISSACSAATPPWFSALTPTLAPASR